MTFTDTSDSVAAGDTWTWDGRSWQALGPSVADVDGQPALAYDPSDRRLLLVANTVTEVPAPTPTPWVPPPGWIRGRPMPLPATSRWTSTLRTWLLEGSGWVEVAKAALSGGLSADPGLGYDPLARRLVLLERNPAFVCMGETGNTVVTGSGNALVEAGSGPGPIPTSMPTPRAQGDPVYPVSPSRPEYSPRPRPGCNFGAPPPQPPGPRWLGGSGWQTGGYSGLAGSIQAPPTQDPQTGDLTVLQDGHLKTWAGHRWVQRPKAPPDGDRSGSALTADLRHGRILLVGGTTQTSAGSDTWTWDGRGWTYRAGTLPDDSGLAQTITYGHSDDSCTADLQPGVTPTTDDGGRAHLQLDLNQSCRPKGITVQLVDRRSRHRLDVDGNAKPLVMTADVMELVWRNWCAQPDQVAALRFDAGGVGVVITVLTPPPCLDSSQPSTLAAKVAG